MAVYLVVRTLQIVAAVTILAIIIIVGDVVFRNHRSDAYMHSATYCEQISKAYVDNPTIKLSIGAAQCLRTQRQQATSNVICDKLLLETKP